MAAHSRSFITVVVVIVMVVVLGVMFTVVVATHLLCVSLSPDSSVFLLLLALEGRIGSLSYDVVAVFSLISQLLLKSLEEWEAGKGFPLFFRSSGASLCQLIFHLGMAHSFIRRRNGGVSGGPAGLLHHSQKSGKIRPRCGIFKPPTSDSLPFHPCRGMMCVQQDLSSCSLQRHHHNSTGAAG